MGKLVLDISMSLDGFVAGPNPSLAEPLGEGGMGLHDWAFVTSAWRESHGLEGGEANVDSKLVDELLAVRAATIMGRRMFSGGAGPWAQDPNSNGWWGDDPPFHHPVFVLTHEARRPLEMAGGTSFTFVTDGIHGALEQARAAAGDRDIAVAGGAMAAQQYLRAGLLDELQIHLVPILLGSGTSLFGDGLAKPAGEIGRVRLVDSPSGTTHLTYRISK